VALWQEVGFGRETVVTAGEEQQGVWTCGVVQAAALLLLLLLLVLLVLLQTTSQLLSRTA
jgi:hypothetical protein